MNFLNEGVSADCSRRGKNGSNLGEVWLSLHSSPFAFCSLHGLIPTAFVPAELLLTWNPQLWNDASSSWTQPTGCLVKRWSLNLAAQLGKIEWELDFFKESPGVEKLSWKKKKRRRKEGRFYIAPHLPPTKKKKTALQGSYSEYE